MTSAIISGRLGVAIVGDTSPRFAIRRDKPQVRVELTPTEASHLLRDASDPEFLSNVDDSTISTRLELASDSSESLDLILFLLDKDLTRETRACAASELEELISNDQVVDRLQQLMYAKPLPGSADMYGAIQFADSYPRVASFLCALRDRQRAIRLVREGWNVLVVDEARRKEIESAFLRYGVFAAFAIALDTGANLSEVVLRFGLNTALKSEVPLLAHLLDAWRRQLPAPSRNAARVEVVGIANPTANTTDITDDYSHIRPIHATGGGARDAALAQVTRITALVNQGKDLQAKQILDELLAEQMRHRNGETHAVKSLCNIAAQIRGTGREDFALDCLLRALNLSADSVAFTQLGTILRDFERYNESRLAYDKALALADPNDVYGLQTIYTAKAHILTDQESYDEAIAAYESIPFGSSSPIIETAIADVYRRKGCFSVAMSRYIKLIKDYPTSDRAYAGKAEIAKRRGNPHRSIQIYNQLLRDDGFFQLEDKSRVIYLLAKSRLLKSVGQWDKAFEIATEVARQEPYNHRAQLQLASLLAIKGQTDESLAQISQLKGKQSTKDWRIHYFRGLIYLRMGKISEARSELLDRIQVAQVLLEDRPLVKSAAAFAHLAEGDPNSAAKELEAVHSADRRIRDLKQVLAVHIRSFDATARPQLPRLRRSNPHLREAVQSIRSGNGSGAIQQELLFLLQAA